MKRILLCFGDSEQAITSSEGAADIIKIRSNNYNLHGNASVTPIQWLALDLKVAWLVQELRRQITTDQYKRMSLFNASAQYKWKQKRRKASSQQR